MMKAGCCRFKQWDGQANCCATANKTLAFLGLESATAFQYSIQDIDLIIYFKISELARDLNGAPQPVATGARWLLSKMDFRSNEAGRTAP
jgi:hypothetical protein